MDKKEIIEKYIECKRIIKEAELKSEEYKEMIREFAEVDDVFEVDDATVSCVKGRASYTYSPELTEKEKLVKKLQKLEVQSAIAIPKYGEPYLVCKFK